jgi:hypothetical protein
MLPGLIFLPLGHVIYHFFDPMSKSPYAVESCSRAGEYGIMRESLQSALLPGRTAL